MNLTLSMPKQFTEKLKKESEATGMSYSEIVRRALDQYFAGKAE
jgi:predicted DNA binding CopG/RHH family protein